MCPLEALATSSLAATRTTVPASATGTKAQPTLITLGNFTLPAQTRMFADYQKCFLLTGVNANGSGERRDRPDEGRDIVSTATASSSPFVDGPL